MGQPSTIFDRLREMRTEGRPLNELIADACSVGIALLEIVERYRSETPLGHQPHMISRVADEAIARAYSINGNTPDNGAKAA